jgi:hypothetical protein
LNDTCLGCAVTGHDRDRVKCAHGGQVDDARAAVEIARDQFVFATDCKPIRAKQIDANRLLEDIWDRFVLSPREVRTCIVDQHIQAFE